MRVPRNPKEYKREKTNMVPHCRLVQTVLLGFVFMGGIDSQSLSLHLGNWGRSDIRLNNNGYTGILVAIDPNTPYNQSLIDTFKNILTTASSFLFNATHHKTYFRDISILIPQHWPQSPGEKFAPAWADTATANIVVESTTNHSYVPPQPFVRQPGHCGNPGEYMHLTPDFIMSGDVGTWGEPAKVLVHEWGHLRWGLFDEYPSPGVDPQFYISSDGRLQGTKCSSSVTGVAVQPVASVALNRGDSVSRDSSDVSCRVREGQIPPRQCRFRPNNIAEQSASGSIMYSINIPSINSFCHGDPTGNPASLHSAEAPTEQNKLCAGQSSWEVMLKSGDFPQAGDSLRADIDTAPAITILRRVERTVLVIDLTLINEEAETEDDESDSVIGMCQRFINESAENSRVGLVMYVSKPKPHVQLTTMTRQGKEYLMALVRNLSSSASSAPSSNPTGPLQAAYHRVILNGSGNEERAVGASIALFSGWNGTSNQAGRDVVRRNVERLRQHSVTLRVVDFGTTENGRRSINVSGILEPSVWYARRPPSPESPEMMEPHHEPTFPDLENNPDLLQVVRVSIDFLPHQRISNPVFIDRTIGRSTTFRFNWDNHPRPVITVRSPSGRAYNSSSKPEAVEGVLSQQLDITLPDVIEKGCWHFDIMNIFYGDQTVEVQVFSAASYPNRPPIRARTVLMQQEIDVGSDPKFILYGEVKQGQMPIGEAIVTMKIDRPNGDGIELRLRDSGVGADIRKNDGIYSAYFTQFTEEGNYQVNMEVQRDTVNTSSANPRFASGVLPANWELVEQPIEIVNLDPFMRAPPETNFEVSGDVQALMENDVFPPARITDLRVMEFSPSARMVRLIWTAMGDDYEMGQAFRYDIRLSNNANIFGRSFTTGLNVTQDFIVEGNLMAPKPSFQTEAMTIRLPPSYCNPVCAIKLRAVDEAENHGIPSNMVTVVMPSVGTTTETITDYTDLTTPRGGAPTTGDFHRRRNSTPRDTPGPNTGGDSMTTINMNSERPRDKPTRHRFTATMIAVAVVTVLFFISIAVVYTIFKQVQCRAGFLTRRRNQHWASPHDTTSETNLEMKGKEKPWKFGKKVSNALVLEDI